MGKARAVVERYYDAFDRKDEAWKNLVATNVRFEGPLQQASGSEEFTRVTEMFLGFHKATRVVARFEDGPRVCSILEFDLETPSGDNMTCLVTELATIESDMIAEVNIIYDPRAFADAFGLS